MLVAVFRNIRYNYVTTISYTPKTGEYVRISDWVDVEFPDRDPTEIENDRLIVLSAVSAEFDAIKE
ncbi:MAG: hypothetical protein WCL08_10910, partial [Verrucomicrobiota bacterium]